MQIKLESLDQRIAAFIVSIYRSTLLLTNKQENIVYGKSSFI